MTLALSWMHALMLSLLAGCCVALPVVVYLLGKVVKIGEQRNAAGDALLFAVRELNGSPAATCVWEITPDEAEAEGREDGKGLMTVHGVRWMRLGDVDIVALDDVFTLTEFAAAHDGSARDLLRTLRKLYGTAIMVGHKRASMADDGLRMGE